MKYNRIFLVIMDSVGAGELPDAKDYNDTGANTLKHIAETAKGLNMPHMQALGLGNLTEIEGVAPIRPEKGYYTKCEELSVGKDTMTGHWEMMGIKTKNFYHIYRAWFSTRAYHRTGKPLR